MQEGLNVQSFVAMLTGFEDLIAEPQGAGVWNLRIPSSPWKMKRALQERAVLVATLERSLLYRAIWLSDVCSDSPGWRVLGSEDGLASLTENLKEGAWALFFFEMLPTQDLLPNEAPVQPSDPHAAAQSVQKLNARAAIWSWYDNDEWSVVVPC